MSGRKYPLDPLAKLRHRQVDAATRELAHAVEARQEAERKRDAAEAVRARAEASAQVLRDEERAALEHGALRAADLHRAQAWELGVEEERKRLAQQVAAAAQGAERARGAETGVQGALASREADAEVVDEDKARFLEREAKRALAKEEEAAQEAHQARAPERWRRER